MTVYVRWLEDVGLTDVASVGGKNASLGEMIQQLQKDGVRVPGGFATTAAAYREFLVSNGIDTQIQSLLDDFHSGASDLTTTARAIRRLFTYQTEFPAGMVEAVREAYAELENRYMPDVDVAVRSSATAEDLPEASFAGQQETYLNIVGADDVLAACRRCYASLFTDRAITYREEHGFDHMEADLSVTVQKMVRADQAGAGVMFTLDTETGFGDVVVINAAWGLGENVVQGSVNPDEYRVFKPLLDDHTLQPIIEKDLGEKEEKVIYAQGGTETVKTVATSENERRRFVLSDEEILQLARWAKRIEAHYEQPLDIEWAKDGGDDLLYVIQARPETVQARKKAGTLRTYTITDDTAEPILQGIAIGDAISTGKVQVIHNPDDIEQFEEGSILVTGVTNPDWVPIMRQAAGIITDYGGRTSHAAIVSRELGLPAIVGTGEATDLLKDGQMITLSCAEAKNGYIYEGALHYETRDLDLASLPETRTQIMMNIASPLGAFRWWRLPVQGIGLARMEFIINNVIQAHPLALLNYDELKDESAKERIDDLTRGYESRTEYFVEHLSRGVAQIAAAQYPHDVIVRMSDFKTSEYADLIGGQQFEPKEANPMLGFRGAARYSDASFRPAFELECQAIKRVRDVIGLTNVVVMIPFCRTLDEADKVLDIMASQGLERGKNDLRVYVMAEIPANIILADHFAERFDGFSIGSNDLTQLTLGVDRDSETLAALFDERNEAIKRFVQQLIREAHAKGRKVGICGEAPSNYPDFAAFLVEAGIDSISVSPDSVVRVIERVAERERSLLTPAAGAPGQD